MSINFYFHALFYLPGGSTLFYGLPPCQAPKEIGLFKIQYIERGGGGSSKALSCLKSACDLTENLMLDKELRLLKRHGL